MDTMAAYASSAPAQQQQQQQQKWGGGGGVDAQSMAAQQAQAMMMLNVPQAGAGQHPPPPQALFTATAVYDCNPGAADELGFRAGQIMEILDANDANWWIGRIGGNVGNVPASHVRANT
jgi:hypothetical protein